MRVVSLAFAALLLLVSPAGAQDTFKIGISAGLTGYAATVDSAWRDGVQVAADVLNAKGGILGRKIEVIVEDNHSEPQQAIVAYKKMIESDKVDVFISGCVSAGNAAAAPMVVRAQIPMILCSILPPREDQQHWAFSTLPPPGFEVETRLAYLRAHNIGAFALLHDPTPYALLQVKAAQKQAAEQGPKLVSDEQYAQADTDLSVQVAKANAAGAGAILKIGLGGTTLTAANDIVQLGLDKMLMLTSLEDIAVFRPVAAVLKDRFFFVASPSQVADALPPGPLKSAIDAFLTPWRKAYGDRDPNWASRGWDAVMLTAAAAARSNATTGEKLRDALEATKDFQGTTGIYTITPDNHYGITKNPFVLGQIVDGHLRVAQ
jgi:ABC-type branched-subunit amino acid transport system substrate-binding protein